MTCILSTDTSVPNEAKPSGHSGGSRSILRKIAGRLDRLRHGGVRLAFGQEAEDIILRGKLAAPVGRRGFYVDVGAHHPTHFSNTHLFHQMGWQGINIDATPGVEPLFRKARPEDIFEEAVVGDGGTVEFVDFAGHAVSGVAGDTADARAAAHPADVVARRTVATRRLGDLLHKHLPAGTPVDFFNVDVEGHELAVLESNDWDAYRPRAVLAEIGDAPTLADALASPVAAYLDGRGYVAFAKTGLTAFFARRDLLRRTLNGFVIGDEATDAHQ